jgi:hypothetical protein
LLSHRARVIADALEYFASDGLLEQRSLLGQAVAVHPIVSMLPLEMVSQKEKNLFTSKQH